jgi:IclR family KDG regulon transcriptional repressor
MRGAGQQDLPPAHRSSGGSCLSAASNRSLKSTAREPRETGSSKSLQKAIRILLHLGENGPEMGITQLSSALHLNKATVYRLLNAFCKFDLIERNPANAMYRLGLRFHELGSRALCARSLQSEARPFLLELAKRSKESVSLAVPGSGGILCLDRVDSPNSIITVRTLIGERFPAHCTAVAKAILAWLPQREAYNVIFRNGMKLYTPLTIPSLRKLKVALDLTRRRGYATDHEELEKGLSGIAAPVLYKGSRVIAALGMAGPTLRFVGPDLVKKIPLLLDFAARISKTLSRGPATFGTVMEPLAGSSLGERTKRTWRTPFALTT